MAFQRQLGNSFVCNPDFLAAFLSTHWASARNLLSRNWRQHRRRCQQQVDVVQRHQAPYDHHFTRGTDLAYQAGVVVVIRAGIAAPNFRCLSTATVLCVLCSAALSVSVRERNSNPAAPNRLYGPVMK